ncbi:MAG: bifunctional cytidylyltransferase/SDR family oxidoreductase [Verrucomicrobia bacterium]|nr:bifunctional cytidylyltransferase/SDR family oxidoreductase [Verrucomicrobiota bacterium]
MIGWFLLNSSDLSPSGIKALILMAGTGERFGSATPKQFHRLAGKKIYLHTLETFLASRLFDEIILVCPEQWMQQVREDLAAYPSASVSITAGGISRQESSFKGLLACAAGTRAVVIHDAVRPLVSLEILRKNVSGALAFGAVDTCIPSADTLVHAPEKERIASIPCRSEYLRGQTPQSFSYPLIIQAHKQAQEWGSSNSSDDCSLVLREGRAVHVVEGSEENIKITSELDLFLAEQILRLRNASSSSIEQKTSLKGKRIAVTGGTGGIGSALCRLLQEEGAIPVVLSRTSPLYPADLTSYSAAKEVFDQVLSDHGPLDGLVNSIGLLKNKQLDQLSDEEIQSQISTNLTGVIYSCKCAHLKKGAHIINIASSSYGRGRKNFSIYASAKAAVVNFTQGLAEEREDLLINAIVPQRTHTPMRSGNFPDENPSTLLDPEEVAREIIHLLKQSCLTGTLVEVRKK